MENEVNITIWQLNRWIPDDEDMGDLSIDRDMRIWAPVYDNRDGICGSRVVGQVPAAQAYYWRMQSFLLRQQQAPSTQPSTTDEEPF